MGVYQDSTDFDQFLGGWVDGVYCLLVLDKRKKFSRRTNVIRPFQFDRNVLVANIICLDPFDDRQCCEILEKYHRCVRGQGDWMTDDSREHERSCGRDPNI